MLRREVDDAAVPDVHAIEIAVIPCCVQPIPHHVEGDRAAPICTGRHFLLRSDDPALERHPSPEEAGVVGPRIEDSAGGVGGRVGGIHSIRLIVRSDVVVVIDIADRCREVRRCTETGAVIGSLEVGIGLTEVDQIVVLDKAVPHTRPIDAVEPGTADHGARPEGHTVVCGAEKLSARHGNMEFSWQFDIVWQRIGRTTRRLEYGKTLTDDIVEDHGVTADEEVVVGGVESLSSTPAIATGVPGKGHTTHRIECCNTVALNAAGAVIVTTRTGIRIVLPSHVTTHVHGRVGDVGRPMGISARERGPGRLESSSGLSGRQLPASCGVAHRVCPAIRPGRVHDEPRGVGGDVQATDVGVVVDARTLPDIAIGSPIGNGGRSAGKIDHTDLLTTHPVDGLEVSPDDQPVPVVGYVEFLDIRSVFVPRIGDR